MLHDILDFFNGKRWGVRVGEGQVVKERAEEVDQDKPRKSHHDSDPGKMLHFPSYNMLWHKMVSSPLQQVLAMQNQNKAIRHRGLNYPQLRRTTRIRYSLHKICAKNQHLIC